MPIDTRHPREIRQDIRRGKLAGITAGLGQNYVQANLAVLPKEQAYDFLLFCQRNPRPCPLLEVTDVGSPEPVGVAPGADLRTDIPRYRIYKDGVLADEVTDATPYWRDDLVAFPAETEIGEATKVVIARGGGVVRREVHAPAGSSQAVERLVRASVHLSDTDLDKPTAGSMAGFAPTWGHLFVLVANHTLMHAGQFTVVRRKLGKPVLF